MRIAFFDSGIGGLSYVPAVRSLLPAARLFYYADTKRFPFGDRSDSEVREFTLEAVARIIEFWDPALVVIACNTASVTALDSLRERFRNVQFVGVVPAVKPAAELSRSGRIGVLATSRTVAAAYLESLIARFAADSLVERVAGGDLVEFVERRLHRAGAGDRRAAVRTAAEAFRGSDVDTVVLACTHFLHVRREIELALGDDVTVIDSSDGVARRVRDLAVRGGYSDISPEPGRDAMAVTAEAVRYEWFAEQFGFRMTTRRTETELWQ